MSLPRFDEITKRAVIAAGGPHAIAQQLGVTRQAAFQWTTLGRIPRLRVADMARLSGIPAEQLRPDLNPMYLKDGGAE